MKKICLILTILLLLTSSLNQSFAETYSGYWQLFDVDNISKNYISDDKTVEFKYEYEDPILRLYSTRRVGGNENLIYGTAKWSVIPYVILPDQNVNIKTWYSLDLFKRYNMNYIVNKLWVQWTTPQVIFGQGDASASFKDTSGNSAITTSVVDGVIKSKEGSLSVSRVIKPGRAGDKMTLNMIVHFDSRFNGFRYYYQWIEANISSEYNTADTFNYGNRITWQPNVDGGVMVYRSEDSNILGELITLKPIEANTFLDLDTTPGRFYYYTIKPVLEDVQFSSAGSFRVKTKEIIEDNKSKNSSIVLRIDDKNMVIDGDMKEVDPGRDTKPIVLSSRTMVPIRAIVEAIGGEVSWDNVTRKITLATSNNKVEMWVDKIDIYVNGVKKTMDVAPIVINSRTYVPVRFAAENLDCLVDWIGNTKDVIILYSK